MKKYKSIELFAGAGGLALGMEIAGFESILFNEIDSMACKTLRKNRPNWHIIEDNIKNIDFSIYHNQIDMLSGGFPCQSFSFAGKKLGFNDPNEHGILFFEFARAIKEINPKIFVAENVRGLLSHDNGDTLKIIKETIDELGYYLVEPKILNASYYKVPQKRERLFLIGIRKNLAQHIPFKWPEEYERILNLKDGLKAGILYPTDVPVSEGQTYSKSKYDVMKQIPAGGYWKHLPDNLQREYMKSSYFSSGGKTGMARRLSWDEPCLTLTCSPAQKQTERCHPEETRPLTIREYARIQTFPDNWIFEGSKTAQYKQIGNAVPVNLAYAIGCSLIQFLDKLNQVNENLNKKLI